MDQRLYIQAMRGTTMKTIIKITCVALLLCIGFIPISTAASFEPAKTALYIGENNPGNYSLLQYAIDHSVHEKNIPRCNDAQTHETTLIRQMMSMGHRYQVPFHLIGQLVSNKYN